VDLGYQEKHLPLTIATGEEEGVLKKGKRE